MGFANIDDVISKLPGQSLNWTKGNSLTVGSPGLFRDLWLDSGTVQGSLSHITSANQGGTYFTSSHQGAFNFANPNSVSAESCCIGKMSVWGKIPGDVVYLYDRVWACRGIHANTTATANIASLAQIRSWDSSKAELWAWIVAPLGNTAATLTVNYVDANATNRSITIPRPFTGSLYLNITNRLNGIPFNSNGIFRVHSVALSAGTGAAGELGLVIRVPKLHIPLGYGAAILDALGTGLLTVGSNECLEMVHYSTSINFDQVGCNLNLITK